MIQRAYGLFQVKEFDEGKGIVMGTATSITPDRVGDVVVPSGAKFKLPLIMLFQHDTRSPIGHVIEADANKNDIDVVSKLVDPAEARSQTVRERLLAAWDDVRLKLTRGFSIGFNPLETEPIKGSFASRYLSWEWLELSVVTIPMHASADIQTIKSLDYQQLAASGRNAAGPVRLITSDPGVSGTKSPAKSGSVKLIPRNYT